MGSYFRYARGKKPRRMKKIKKAGKTLGQQGSIVTKNMHGLYKGYKGTIV